MIKSFEIRLCENPSCRLRYPLIKDHPYGDRCPLCLGSTIVAITREMPSEPIPTLAKPAIRFEALLDNIRSTWNVGAIFRTADCFGVQKIHLCGITPTPDHPAVAKTALGAHEVIPWTQSRNALETVTNLTAAGARIWALEQDEKALPISSDFEADERPIILILGNEVCGVDPALLDLCERIVYIPMFGIKRSLNVEVAFGAALSVFRNRV